MGFTWHERKTDAGIDGEIELRNPVTGEVANRLILIQSKASDRRFPGENDRSFHFLCKQADVAYWMSADGPVLLICSHPQTGDAWWMHVQGWFSDPAHRASGRIDFDKRTQRFDTDAAHRLLNLADPHGRPPGGAPRRDADQQSAHRHHPGPAVQHAHAATACAGGVRTAAGSRW